MHAVPLLTVPDLTTYDSQLMLTNEENATMSSHGWCEVYLAVLVYVYVSDDCFVLQ